MSMVTQVTTPGNTRRGSISRSILYTRGELIEYQQSGETGRVAFDCGELGLLNGGGRQSCPP
jgi:hypothetical protein